MLPLVKWLPVALTHHLDRKKNLLRGRVGYILDWFLDEREDSVFDGEKRILKYLPTRVDVQFYDQVRTAMRPLQPSFGPSIPSPAHKGPRLSCAN
eukprot:1289114-Karenia_brevis.AAC.1